MRDTHFLTTLLQQDAKEEEEDGGGGGGEQWKPPCLRRSATCQSSLPTPVTIMLLLLNRLNVFSLQTCPLGSSHRLLVRSLVVQFIPKSIFFHPKKPTPTHYLLVNHVLQYLEALEWQE